MSFPVGLTRLAALAAGKRKEAQLAPQRSRFEEDEEFDSNVVCRKNFELMDKGWFSLGCPNATRLPVSDLTGVHDKFHVNVEACATLRHYVTNLENRDKNGFLRVGDDIFCGFHEYVHSEAHEHSALRQAQFTTMLDGEPLRQACVALPALNVIVLEACKLLGCDVEWLQCAHFLLQYSPLAVFTWHNDAGDLLLDNRAVSVIVPLDEVPSGVELWGFGLHLYEGVGACAVFPGAARHRSVAMRPVHDTGKLILQVAPDEWEGTSVKLALFFARRSMAKKA